MSFDDYQPKVADDQIAYDGDEYVKSTEAHPCMKCKAETHWLSISFDAPLCSTECADALWKRYFESGDAMWKRYFESGDAAD